MYPQRELSQLSAYKAALCRRIVIRRSQCAVGAINVLRPLHWLEKVKTIWNRISPAAALLGSATAKWFG